jgi:hypothetical protein
MIQRKTAGSGRPSADPSWQVSAADSPQPTESLFAENHEPFFNAIDPEQSLSIRRFKKDGF